MTDELTPRRPVYLSDKRQPLGLLPTMSFWTTRSAVAKFLNLAVPSGVSSYIGAKTDLGILIAFAVGFGGWMLGLGLFERWVRSKMKTRPE